MRPYGPSPLMNGIFISCSKLNMMMGSVKTSVFPEPVNAMPIMSRPDNIAGIPGGKKSRVDQRLIMGKRRNYMGSLKDLKPTLNLDGSGCDDAFLFKALDD